MPTVISRLTVILVLCSVACRSPEDRTSGVRWEYQWDTDDPVGRIVEKNSQIGLPKHGAIVFPPTLGPSGAVYLRRPHEYTEPKGDSLVATGNNFWELRPSGGLCISPAIADDGTILLGTEDGSVWAVSPGGKKKWTYGFPEATYFPAVDFGGGYSAQAHSPGCSQPAIAVDGTSYWVGHGVYALTKDGLPRWAFEPGEDFVFVCIGADGTIYALANGAIFAITPDGKQQWEFTVEKTKYFAGEIALGSDGTLYVTLMNSHFALLLLTPHGGVKRHYESSSSDVFAVPGQTLIAPDGTVYVTKNSENRTFVVAIDSNGGVEWTGPQGSHSFAVAADGTLYICVVRDLVAIGPGKKTLWKAQLPENPDETESHSPTSAVTLSFDGRFYIGDFWGRLGVLDTSVGLATTGWPSRFHDARNTSRAGAH